MVPGRTHKVELFYVQEAKPDYVEAAIRSVLMIYRTGAHGDILFFLTGEEIEDAWRKIKLEEMSSSVKTQILSGLSSVLLYTQHYLRNSNNVLSTHHHHHLASLVAHQVARSLCQLTSLRRRL